jgi:hypothetical protein
VAAGVIDPAKVTRCALQNAASIAGLMLTTEALISELQEDDKSRADCSRNKPERVADRSRLRQANEALLAQHLDSSQTRLVDGNAGNLDLSLCEIGGNLFYSHFTFTEIE